MDSRTFYQRVYRIVSEIPAGSVMTYGQIAFYAGKPRAARFVGRAMRLAPPGLPCHRVVGKNGALAPAEAFGGPGAQRALLEREGIAFLPGGRVNMKKHWLQG
ncbi:DNA base-flipping protein [Caprobacter fermentans]|uniref:DNA base-flipping protein n=1 Tax=Caproicibacter fermentans TaxID=2576756 RepID=A0A6N8HYR4_9FIRM|nr:MGMT family protein [Caproicibacter fermentans]MVB10956.1 DNA base-flipping protein [Caproicibacter fermentans]